MRMSCLYLILTDQVLMAIMTHFCLLDELFVLVWGGGGGGGLVEAGGCAVWTPCPHLWIRTCISY